MAIKNLKENPAYFGCYLNMARHNIFEICDFINEKYNFILKTNFKFTKNNNGEKDDSLIKDCSKNLILNLTDDTLINETNGIYSLLKTFLPIVKIFNEEDLIFEKKVINKKGLDIYELTTFLKEAFTLIDKYRNNFTHYLALDENKNEKQDELRENLVVNISFKEKFEKLFAQSIEIVKYKNKKKLQDKYTDENFKHINEYYKPFDDTYYFTEKGFYFFICLFLERDYAWLFLKQIKGFKNDSNLNYKATLEVYTAFAINLPKVKLGSIDINQSLILDMVNELCKCPLQIYNYLSDWNKKKFIPEISAVSQQNMIDNNIDLQEINDDDTIENEIKNMVHLKRTKENRFPYFVLRWIEVMGYLPNIKFQIRLGKVCLDSYLKENYGTRKIFKEINAFGDLKDFIDIKSCTNQQKIDPIEYNNSIEQKIGIAENEAHIYFEQYAPHYHIENNKIGFYFFDEMETKQKLPTLIETENGKRKTIKLHQPTGFLSIHDLYKIGYILCENNSTNSNSGCNKIEGKIKSILNNNGVNKNPINNEAHILNKIKEMYIDIIGRFKKGKVKPIKIGEMASFLVKDIIYFITDKKTKDGIKDYVYNDLQRIFATTFNTEKDIIIKKLEVLNIIGKNVKNAFLNEDIINKSNTIQEFYENYLTDKKAWIDTYFKKEVTQKKSSIFNFKKFEFKNIEQFFSADNLPYNFIKKNKITGSENAMFINIPGNIFDEIIHQENKINWYFKSIIQENKQKFYNYTRKYKLNENSIIKFKTWEKYKNVPKKNIDKKNLKTKFNKIVFQNEKEIGHQWINDFVLSKMINCLANKNGLTNFNINLNDIIEKDNKIFNPFDNTLKIELKIDNKIIIEDRKLKDCDSLRKLQYDRRIPDLLKWFDGNEIPASYIDYQLKEYNKYRAKIFEKIFELEKQLSEKFMDEIKTLKHPFLNIQFDKFVEIINNNKLIKNSAELNFLINVRNKFSHTQFVEYEKIEKIGEFGLIKINSNEINGDQISISEKICTEFDKIIKKIFEKL